MAFHTDVRITEEMYTYLPTIIHNIHKPRVKQGLLMQRPYRHLPPKLRRRLLQPDLELIVRTRLGQTIVVRAGPGVEIREFDPAARCEVRVGLTEEGGPVGDAAAHGAHLDEVEGAGEGEGPLGFTVVDFEFEVWWDPVVGS